MRKLIEADTKSLTEANCADTIRGQILIEGGKYSRKYGIYMCVQFFFVIERTRDLIYHKFVATDFSPKIISHSAGENSGDSV